MNEEALYLAKPAYEAWCAVRGVIRPFVDLSNSEKNAWEAAADAVRHVVMRTLMQR